MINPGQYKGRAIKSTVQLGETESGTLQIAVNIDVKDAQGASIGSMTTFMFFSEKASVYSWERLGLLGWKGKGPDDILADETLPGIDANEVNVRVTKAETYKDASGVEKMGTSKLEIVTGGGNVKISKPLDKNTFVARLRALSGAPGNSGGAPATGGGGPNPPF